MKYEKGMFQGKKITIMGLGLLGRGLGDVQFFAEEGAELIVTDLKTAEQLKDSIEKLSQYTNIKYVLGEHRLEDFQGRDFILKAAGVPINSPYIEEAQKNNIPIEMDASFFAKLAEGVTIVGITGTRGKTTTTSLVYTILSEAYEGSSKNVYLGGNIRGVATLPLIREIKKGDIVVAELDSWQLQGFGDSKISPHISVFTNLLKDHINYYKDQPDRYFEDKANIFRYQKSGDYCVVGEVIAKEILSKYGSEIKGKFIQTNREKIPASWNVKLRGKHNRDNIILAIEAVKILGIPEEKVQKAVEGFKGVPGRLQFVKNYHGINIYNDTTATTPDATLVGLETLSYNRNVALIMGGADKMLDMSELIKNVGTYAKFVILLPGSGTDAIREEITKLVDIETVVALDLKDAVEKAIQCVKKGDVILFSPAFASFGMFKNEYDRGDQFNAIVDSL